MTSTDDDAGYVRRFAVRCHDRSGRTWSWDGAHWTLGRALEYERLADARQAAADSAPSRPLPARAPVVETVTSLAPRTTGPQRGLDLGL